MRYLNKPIDPEEHSTLPSDTPMPGAKNNSSLRSRRNAVASTLAAALLVAVCGLPQIARASGQTKPPGQPQTKPSGPPGEKKHEARHEIDRLEEKWRTAILNSDTAAMDSLLDNDYMATTASGTLQTKAQSLDNLRSGRTHFSSLEISDRKVRFYGTTAIVTSLAEVQGTSAEGPIQGSFRYTRVYVKNAAGAWKIVSFEASSVREPEEHK
jgi:ketosteroid isomerase-like protein